MKYIYAAIVVSLIGSIYLSIQQNKKHPLVGKVTFAFFFELIAALFIVGLPVWGSWVYYFITGHYFIF